MSNQNGLTVLGKQHQISFPMARLAAFVDVGGPSLDGHTALDVIERTATFASPPTALSFCTGKVVPPAIVLGASNLSVDKSIDGLMADDLTSLFLLQSARHLGRGPTLSQPFENQRLQRRITNQSAPFPATAFCLLLSVSRLIAHLRAAVAFKLASYGRWRAIHSCRDLADCFPGLAMPGNRATLFQRKLSIVLSHRNTL